MGSTSFLPVPALRGQATSSRRNTSDSRGSQAKLPLPAPPDVGPTDTYQSKFLGSCNQLKGELDAQLKIQTEDESVLPTSMSVSLCSCPLTSCSFVS